MALWGVQKAKMAWYVVVVALVLQLQINLPHALAKCLAGLVMHVTNGSVTKDLDALATPCRVLYPVVGMDGAELMVYATTQNIQV